MGDHEMSIVCSIVSLHWHQLLLGNSEQLLVVVDVWPFGAASHRTFSWIIACEPVILDTIECFPAHNAPFLALLTLHPQHIGTLVKLKHHKVRRQDIQFVFLSLHTTQEVTAPDCIKLPTLQHAERNSAAAYHSCPAAGDVQQGHSNAILKANMQSHRLVAPVPWS